MRENRRVLRVGLLVAFLVVTVVSAAQAYRGQTHWSVTVSANAAVVSCDKDVKLTATVLDTATNRPVRDEKVTWSITSSPSHDDRLSDRWTRTNGAGKATVTLSFGDKAGVRVDHGDCRSGAGDGDRDLHQGLASRRWARLAAPSLPPARLP